MDSEVKIRFLPFIYVFIFQSVTSNYNLNLIFGIHDFFTGRQKTECLEVKFRLRRIGVTICEAFKI